MIANALTKEGVVGYYSTEFRVESPAVTVTGRGDVGHAKAREVNYTPVVRLLSIKSDHNIYFLENAINNHKVVVESTGVPQLTVPQLGNYRIHFPDYYEQVLIGNFFSNIDKTITLHHRKSKRDFFLRFLVYITKSVNKSEFWAFDSCFAYTWVQRKLKNISKINPVSTIPSKFNYVDLESVLGTELKSSRKESIETAPSRAQRLAIKGDLFYQTVRPYQKNNYLFKRDDANFVFSTGYAQVRPEIDGYFLLSLVQTTKFVNSVLVRCTGTSYPAINSSDLSLIPIKIPGNNTESINIGMLFSNIDNAITLHQRE